MNTDTNLLLGVLALQSDLIDSRQFIDACVLWTSDKERPLLDLLVERGWIKEDDKSHLEYFLRRRLEKQDAQSSLTAVLSEDIRLSLAELGDEQIDQSICGQNHRDTQEVDRTLAYLPAAEERYHLKGLHATGGIGRVWLAHDRALDRDVALKDLRPEFGDNPNSCERFLREARFTGQLEHPGIVPVYEVAQREQNSEPFYTMRFVKGHTLRKAVRRFHQSVADGDKSLSGLIPLLNAFVTVCKTIAYAHSQGIIHRDLKGQNVMLGDFGEVVVLDWGLAKRLGTQEESFVEPSSVAAMEPVEPGLTMHGQAVGTPAYMAPEQASGITDQINHLTDVYGLGAILYEILTGVPPFSGGSSQEVLNRIRTEAPLPPREIFPNVPSLLESVCMRALAKSPEDRFASAEELGLAVEQWQQVERQRVQEALADSEALYHSLVETIPMNVWRKDKEGRFTFANTGFCEATGWTQEQLLGKTDFEIGFSPEFAEKYRSDDLRVMENGETIDLLEENERPDGTRIHVRVIKLPIRDADGDIIGTQGIFWDITDRKNLEEALAAATSELEATRASLSLRESRALGPGEGFQDLRRIDESNRT